MAEVLEAEGWSIGTDGRVARTIERGSATIEQVNASSPLARVALNGKTRWVSVRDLVAFQHLGMPPANTTLTSINGNPCRHVGRESGIQAAHRQAGRGAGQSGQEGAGASREACREGRGSGQEGAGGRPALPRSRQGWLHRRPSAQGQRNRLPKPTNEQRGAAKVAPLLFGEENPDGRCTRGDATGDIERPCCVVTTRRRRAADRRRGSHRRRHGRGGALDEWLRRGR